MASIELSQHAQDMLAERNIREEWLWQTVNAPDKTWRGSDGNFHYAKVIALRQHGALHVVIDDGEEPHCVVTVFFDRRLQL